MQLSMWLLAACYTSFTFIANLSPSGHVQYAPLQLTDLLYHRYLILMCAVNEGHDELGPGVTFSKFLISDSAAVPFH